MPLLAEALWSLVHHRSDVYLDDYLGGNPYVRLVPEISLALAANIKDEKRLSSRPDERRTLWSGLRLPIYLARESFSSIGHG